MRKVAYLKGIATCRLREGGHQWRKKQANEQSKYAEVQIIFASLLSDGRRVALRQLQAKVACLHSSLALSNILK